MVKNKNMHYESAPIDTLPSEVMTTPALANSTAVPETAAAPDFDYALIPKPNEVSDHWLFQAYDQVRVEWVQNIFKWLPPAPSDIDRYDTDEATQIVGLVHSDDEALIGGMRLTPTDELEQTLSWEMVQATFADRASEVKVQLHRQPGFSEALARSRVFDITRAFPSPDYSARAEETLLRLFGAGINLCDALQDENEMPKDYFWFFTLNKGLTAFLQKHDIPFIQVAEDETDPNEWMRMRVVLVDMYASYAHVAAGVAYSPSHQIIVEAVTKA